MPLKKLYDTRNAPYCEIFLGTRHFFSIHFDIYNSFQISPYDPEKWHLLTEEKIKQETGSSIVIFNKPRYWTMDQINLCHEEHPVRTLGGIKMQLVATITIPTFLFGAWHKRYHPYKRLTVARTTSFLYTAGKPIYELIAQDHSTYIMQSCPIPSDGSPETTANLATLGQRLHLPPGWQFKTRILTKDFSLETFQDNKAIIIQDDFYNTYQFCNKGAPLP